MTLSIERPEHEILIRSARTRVLPENSARIAQLAGGHIDWEYVRVLAARHNTVAQLQNHLKTIPSDVLPPKFASTLRDDVQRTAIRSLRQSGDLLKIMRTLNDAGIACLTYKGPVLAAIAYGDTPRSQSDLDVLVHPEDLDKALEALVASGFRLDWSLSEAQRQLHVKYGYEQTLYADNDRIRLEIHWHLDGKRYSLGIATSELFRRSIEVSMGGSRVRTLSDEDLLVFLSWHGAKHFWKPIRQIVDIVALVEARPIDWDVAAARSRTIGMQNVVAVALVLGRDLLGLRIPDRALAAFPITSAAQRIADRHRESTFDEPPWFCDQPWSTQIFLAEARAQVELRCGLLIKARVAATLTFTPSERDALEMDGPGSNPYLVRLGRMASRHLSSRLSRNRVPSQQ